MLGLERSLKLLHSVSFQNSMTALIVAVKGGYTEVVKELLKRNPNVNMTDKDGNTALAIAAKEGHTEIVQDLLDAGTYVNIPDRVRPPCDSIKSFLLENIIEWFL